MLSHLIMGKYEGILFKVKLLKFTVNDDLKLSGSIVIKTTEFRYTCNITDNLPS